jgi:hypothetical protein
MLIVNIKLQAIKQHIKQSKYKQNKQPKKTTSLLLEEEKRKYN